MGVPAFFRWLSRKYPSVIVHCVEQKTIDINGVKIPIDASEPNPNGIEFDNLYLDMNGIIHPCTHPEDKPAPRNEDEMMIAIFECIDRLFNIVRPRKVLYMAIDGVAPRAKMNQQRSRRFRASKETTEKISEISRVRAELLLKGAHLPPEKPKGEHFDSNCITPGTPFMQRLSDCLHYYIHERLNNAPGWKGIKVILSDANVPGEGEHKIMDFIRKQRAQPDHDPNTQHVLCGADADLIMLGLATHEPNFTIIREEFKPNKPRPCDVCGQIGHEMKDCIGAEKVEGEPPMELGSEGDFIFVRLSVLREYLENDLKMPNLPFPYDFERVVDDWVFMCFFVGNDFLPHLPSLEIREGAIDRLVTLYKDTVYKTKGYLTKSGEVDLERVQMIMTQLGEVEDEIFKKRQQTELHFKAREKAKKRRMQGFNEYRPNWKLVQGTQFEPRAVGNSRALLNPRQEAFNIRKAGMHVQNSQLDNKLQSVNSRNALESMMRPADGTNEEDGRKKSDVEENSKKRKRDDEDGEEEEDDQAHDEVRLWEDGFKDRYYESKFDVSPENLEFRYSVALQYVRGLCWVLKYYYQGCASWKWFFPYHYAPFASDFVNIAGLSTEFQKDTEPFRPLQQLMGVFPAASGSHVPPAWRHLMSDPESPIIDFYPEDFKIDLNGKKFAWQGVALLPFVDENRLFKALEPYYNKLTPEEIKRNVRGDDKLYVASKNSGYDLIKGLYDNDVDSNQETAILIDGMQGTVLVWEDCTLPGGRLNCPLRELPPIEDNQVVCVRYRDPNYGKDFVFPAVKLKGAQTPPRVLKPSDLTPEENRKFRPMIGMTHSSQRGSVTDAGHRMLGHYNRPNQYQPRGGGGGGSGGYNQGYGGNNHQQTYGNYRAGRGGEHHHNSYHHHQNRYQPYQQQAPQHQQRNPGYHSSSHPHSRGGINSRDPRDQQGGRGGYNARRNFETSRYNYRR